ncbi:PRA1 family protein 2 isoform X3 [Anguilla rostrata]|uniref:PRA1 family protein 2 isoform X3 n=1 Tax=Anguilla rostrata TaxID=7938 RepID=UPI0030D0AEB4
MTSNENCRPCQCFKGVPCRFLSCRHECHQIYRRRYFRPLQLLLGALVVVLVFLGFVWVAENQAAVRRFRRTHPGLCLSAILGGAYLLLSVLGGVAVFLFGIAFPILLILIHASVRLRSLKNKLENKLESIGLKRTPMGLLLEALGQEQEAGS